MEYRNIEKIIERIKRINKRLNQKDGEGLGWDAKFPDGTITTYSFNNLKTEEEYIDDISNIIIWLWSLKDYFKQISIEKGKDKQFIEDFVNKKTYLCVCADMANTFKHGKLNNHRSGKQPKLGRLEFTIPDKSLTRISFMENAIEVDVKNHEHVEIYFPILDKDDNHIEDAFVLITHCVDRWEELANTLNINV